MIESGSGLGKGGGTSSTTVSTMGGLEDFVESGEGMTVEREVSISGSEEEAQDGRSWLTREGVEILLAVRCCCRLECEEWEDKGERGAVVESKWK